MKSATAISYELDDNELADKDMNTLLFLSLHLPFMRFSISYTKGCLPDGNPD